jgi:hypothetical protein
MDRANMDRESLMANFEINENVDINESRNIKVVTVSAIQKVGFATAGNNFY